MRLTVRLHGDSLPDDAEVVAYDVREAISTPFGIDVVIRTADGAFRVEDSLQNRLLLEVGDEKGRVRHFDGLPDKVGFESHDGKFFLFRLRLRPALIVLEHREGSRIFQDLTPVDVIKAVLADAGVDGDVEWRLRQSYEKREFLCQYCETELNFVHRLLEDEGIFYFFHHSAEGHTLIFADDPEAFAAQDGVEPVAMTAQQGLGGDALLEICRTTSLRPTEASLRDYDFDKPDVYPEGAVPAPGPLGVSHFEYPGGFTKSDEGKRRAARRLSEIRRDLHVVRGKGRAVGLVCGAPMTVEGARAPTLNGEFVVTELRTTGAGEESFTNEFTAIVKGAPFAAPRKATKPRIRGVQTAVVTGPSNEPQAIHVDKYGRIKVRFFWDRAGKQDDSSSCWLRVSQLGLGNSMVLPRVGWEVSVAFLDGDPDRPIALGRVYNAENTPPYALPGAAADGSMKSMASPGGAGHNELKFGDSGGSQGMGISAQKDLNVSSGNDKTETVGANDDHSVGSNYKVVVGASETTNVGANQSIDVGNAFQVKVSGAQAISVGGSEDAHAKCDYVESVGGARAYAVAGNQITISCGVRQNISGAYTRNINALQLNLSVASINDTMLGSYTESVTAVSAQVAAGPVVEKVRAGKDATTLAGELHLVSGMSTSAASVTQLIGAAHVRNCGGDYVVSAPIIALGGGTGKFNGGGSHIHLNGGPVVIKGAKIAINAGAIVKFGSDLKIS